MFSNSGKKTRRVGICIIAISIVFLVGCGGSTGATRVASEIATDEAENATTYSAATRKPTNTPTPTNTPSPTITPSPTATPQVLPLRIDSPEWSFTIDEVELRRQVKDGSRTIKPENDAFLILLGDLENHTSERECNKASDWSMENTNTGEEYGFDHSISDAVKEIHGGLDYPGSFRGICVDGNSSRRTFVGFDVPQDSELTLHFLKLDDGPIVQVDTAMSLANRPTITPIPSPTATGTATPIPSSTPTPTPTSPPPVANATVLQGANLRSGPGSDYAVIGGVAQGDELPIYGRNDDSTWLLVSLDPHTWIWAPLVEIAGDIADIGTGPTPLPSATPTPLPTATHTPSPVPSPTIRPTSTASFADISEVWTLCKLLVEESLKAPRTAKFPWADYDSVGRLDENRYVVQSYVDAENSFGAMIRNRYICTLIKTEDGGWELEDLQIGR